MDYEVEFFWRKEPSTHSRARPRSNRMSSALFLVNRYLFLLTNVLYLCGYLRMSDEVSLDSILPNSLCSFSSQR